MANLIIMVGISGSGKSTLAEQIAKSENAVICSADLIREELYSSADVLGDGRVIFGILNDRIKKYLKKGQSVVVDNTNTTSSARKSLLKFDNIDKKIAYVIDCDVSQAMKNQEGRVRKVPQEVVQRQYNQMQKDLPNLESEVDLIIYPEELLTYKKRPSI